MKGEKMNMSDAIEQILNMRGGISAKEKLREIRGALSNDEYDLNSFVACLRGEHSRRKKLRKRTGR